jgi:hypothetical protein
MLKGFKTLVIFCFAGIVMLSGCKKDYTYYVPISFTDKDGNIFIKIDTSNNNIHAYSVSTISTGSLKGVFNDTIRSSFQLAIITDSYWNGHYHRRDTVVLPTIYGAKTTSFVTNVDLRDCTPPYHFILWGLPNQTLKCGSHGFPSIVMTVDTRQ